MSTVLSDMTSKKTCNQAPAMQIVKAAQTVHCPTCGSLAERRLLKKQQTSNQEHCIQTACPSCDYLMVVGSLTGRVLEAYAPGQMSA